MNVLNGRFYRYHLWKIILGVFLAWFLLSFLIVPNVKIIYDTFFSTGTFSFETIEKLINSERAVRSIINSIILAVILVITVNIVGTFIVLVLNYFDIKGSRILRLGFFTTLIYGGVALNFGYKLVYGEYGIITKLLMNVFPDLNPSWFSGLFAVAFVMTFACTSNHVLFLTSAIHSIDFHTVEAAKNLGASQFYILRKVVLPTLKPTLFALTILTFLTGLGAVSAPLVFGGQEFETITPMILTFSKSTSSRDLATVLSLFLGLVTVIVLSFLLRSEEKGNYISVSKTKEVLKKQRITNKTANIIVHIITYLLFAIYVIPVLTIIVFSFTDAKAISTGEITLDTFTLKNYALTFSGLDSIKPYLVSLSYGFVASLLVVIFCLICAYWMRKYPNKLTKTLDYILMIPWFLPATLIAIGLIITYHTPNLFVFNQVLTGTLWILLIGYVIIKIPFTIRISKSAFFSVSIEIEEAAKNLGAKTTYTFIRVILPIIIPTILGVFALNFISILPDYDLTVFLYHPLYEPLGITIMNATKNTVTADTKALNLVYTVILMGINTLILFFVYGRLGFNRKASDVNE